MTTPTPAIPTFTDGVPAHAVALNALGSNITNLYNYSLGGFLTSPPFVIANQTTAQSITSAETSLSFNTTIVNSNNMWVASQPSQLTIQTTGTYLFIGQFSTGLGATATYAYATITVNGTGLGNRIATCTLTQATTSATSPAIMLSQAYRLSAGSTVNLRAAQGSTTNTNVGNLVNSSLTALWLSS
jgi:hypothetical protein